MPESSRRAVVAVLEELSTAVGANAGCALYRDDGDGVLQLVASAGHAPGRAPTFWRRVRGMGGARDPRTLVLSLPTDAPGVLVLARVGGAEFTQQDMSLARLYMRQLVDVAPEVRDGLHQNGWTQQLEAIQRIAARLTRLASVDEVAGAICTETSQLIAYDEAHVIVSGDNNAAFAVIVSAGGAREDSTRALPTSGPAGRALHRAVIAGTPVIAANIADLGAGHNDPVSMLLVPLRSDNRVNGAVCLFARGASRFGDDDMRLLQILCDQAAVAIENARLLAGRDELVQELAALLDVSEAAGRAGDQVDLARTLGEKMRHAAQADGVRISRWEEGSISLHELWRNGIVGDLLPAALDSSPIRRQVLTEGRTATVDADNSKQTADEARLREMGGRALLLVPLNASGRTIGIVELVAVRGSSAPDAAALQTVEAMATLGATGLEKVRLLEQLRSAADMDLVTGVHNHRYLQERLRQEVARSARSHSPFGVLMLDLDNFKPVNDRHGHADGDRVLRNIGAAIRHHVRASDVVARYGGDEFVVLMPDTPAEHADALAKRVVAGVLKERHVMGDGDEVGVGISAGLAVYPADGRTSASLLQAADAAMYAAKRSGGKQVERSGPVAIPVEASPTPAAVVS